MKNSLLFSFKSTINKIKTKLVRGLGKILFVFGILFGIVGFTFDNAEQIPVVYKVFLPKYNKEKEAIDYVENLNQGEKLQKNSMKFEILSQLILGNLAKNNSIDAVQVSEIIKNGESGLTLGNIINRDISLRIILKKEEKYYNFGISTHELNEQIEEMKNKNVFNWSLFLFSLGVLLEIIGWKIENKKETK